MGISFGSKSVKPYFGSKEVQEAYVGSQLVYQSKPPYTYVFLGGESKYYLADYATIDSGIAIQKESGVYRVVFPSGTSNIPYLTITQVNGNKLKFIYKPESYSSTTTLYVAGNNGGTFWPQITNIKMEVNDYTLASITIPSNYTQVRIGVSGYTRCFVDAIRYETE